MSVIPRSKVLYFAPTVGTSSSEWQWHRHSEPKAGSCDVAALEDLIITSSKLCQRQANTTRCPEEEGEETEAKKVCLKYFLQPDDDIIPLPRYNASMSYYNHCIVTCNSLFRLVSVLPRAMKLLLWLSAVLSVAAASLHHPSARPWRWEVDPFAVVVGDFIPVRVPRPPAPSPVFFPETVEDGISPAEFFAQTVGDLLFDDGPQEEEAVILSQEEEEEEAEELQARRRNSSFGLGTAFWN